MGFFSKDDPTDDSGLIKAARRRILAELEAKHQGVSNTINNNMGPSGGGSGLMERMNGGGAPDDESLRDYLVDIERRDLPERDPITNKPVGWTKKVHRHVEKKK